MTTAPETIEAVASGEPTARDQQLQEVEHLIQICHVAIKALSDHVFDDDDEGWTVDAVEAQLARALAILRDR